MWDLIVSVPGHCLSFNSDTSISSENQLIGINLGGQELQVDTKKQKKKKKKKKKWTYFHSQS